MMREISNSGPATGLFGAESRTTNDQTGHHGHQRHLPSDVGWSLHGDGGIFTRIVSENLQHKVVTPVSQSTPGLDVAPEAFNVFDLIGQVFGGPFIKMKSPTYWLIPFLSTMAGLDRPLTSSQGSHASEAATDASPPPTRLP